MNYVFITLVSVALLLIAQDAINPNTRRSSARRCLIRTLWPSSPSFSSHRGGNAIPAAYFRVVRGKSPLLSYGHGGCLRCLPSLAVYFCRLDWTVLFYLLQYVPASVALCWCYEKSGTIWSPIVLHAAINLISINVTVG
jgi:membrane protease YdiL (CAAX protease family)